MLDAIGLLSHGPACSTPIEGTWLLAWFLTVFTVWGLVGPCNSTWKKVVLSIAILSGCIIAYEKEILNLVASMTAANLGLKLIFWILTVFILWVFVTVAASYKFTTSNWTTTRRLLRDRARSGILSLKKNLKRQAEEVLTRFGV
jgi:hypothetical protein